MRLSGLEPFNYEPDEKDYRKTFINLGERCNVAGSTIFKKAIVDGNYEKALAIALKQVENGAHVIDVNMDDGLIDGESAMIQVREPDGVRARRVQGALHDRLVEVPRRRGRPQVLPGQVHRELHLAQGWRGGVPQPGEDVKRHGAAVVVMAFDEKGQAAD